MPNLKIALLTFLFSLSLFATESKILTSDQYIQFARGNKIKFAKGSEVKYRDDGSILYVFAKGNTDELATWTTKANVSYKMHCGSKILRSSQSIHSASLIWFYPSGEYKRGCVAVSTFDFKTAQVNGKVGFNSDIALFESGEIEYLSSIDQGKASVFETELTLKSRSEINFHSDGRLRFFTPAREQVYTCESQYGHIIYQQITPEVSISLFEDGLIERAIIGQDISLHGVVVSKGSGVIFDRLKKPTSSAPYLLVVFLTRNHQLVTSDGYSLEASSVKFKQQGVIELVEIAKNFDFKRPDNGRIVSVRVGDLVYFDEKMNISKIDFKVKR